MGAPGCSLDKPSTITLSPALTPGLDDPQVVTAHIHPVAQRDRANRGDVPPSLSRSAT